MIHAIKDRETNYSDNYNSVTYEISTNLHYGVPSVQRIWKH